VVAQRRLYQGNQILRLGLRRIPAAIACDGLLISCITDAASRPAMASFSDRRSALSKRSVRSSPGESRGGVAGAISFIAIRLCCNMISRVPQKGSGLPRAEKGVTGDPLRDSYLRRDPAEALLRPFFSCAGALAAVLPSIPSGWPEGVPSSLTTLSTTPSIRLSMVR
jgi:hypothetical protein